MWSECKTGVSEPHEYIGADIENHELNFRGASHDGGCTGERGKSTLEPVVEDEGSSNSNVANQEAMEKSEGECNTESTATASNSNNNNNCYNQDGQAKPIPPKLSAETDNVNRYVCCKPV